MNEKLPAGLELARTTQTFNRGTVPAGLLGTHRVADGVWGRLVVHTGRLNFHFEGDPESPISVAAGGQVIIAPGRPHHLELDSQVTFVVEFYRPTADRVED